MVKLSVPSEIHPQTWKVPAIEISDRSEIIPEIHDITVIPEDSRRASIISLFKIRQKENMEKHILVNSSWKKY